mgnify:CR=1 FL=1
MTSPSRPRPPARPRVHALELVLVAALPLQLAACLKPNPLALELADDDASESSETSDASTSETSADTSEGMPGSETSEGSEGSEATTDAPADLPGDTGSECSAPPEFAPDCGACLIMSCCTSLVPCADDFVCVCLADCLFAGGSNNECRMLCGEKPADVEPLAPLLSCASQDCPVCMAG